MWRRNAFSENQDSDQSISEEEDVDGDWTENAISLGGPSDRKGKMQMLSQLETLGADMVSVSSNERKSGTSVDDEVENPHFKVEDDSTQHLRITSALDSGKEMICLPTIAPLSHSDEETISDEEKISSSALEILKENVDRTSEASQQTEALDCGHENSGGPSFHGVSRRETKSLKAGGRPKTKPKFTFRFQPREEDISLLVSDGNEKASMLDEFDAAAPRDMVKFMDDSQLNFHEEESDQLESPDCPVVQSELAPEPDLKEHSMSEILDCFHERSSLLHRSLKMDISKRGRRLKMVPDTRVLPLGHGNLDDDGDDLPEALEVSPPMPSDDELFEENPHRLRSNSTIRSMADQFHEAYGTVSEVDERSYLALPGPLCTGLYGKLQRVIQSEKDRDTIYVKSLSEEAGCRDERLCILVKILSKSLEAKLTVCTCSYVGDGETTCLEDDLQMNTSPNRKATIIFSPRICSDVELEVGDLICIHPPWKEVQVKGKYEVIILCSYFSQGESG